jgi:DNA-binding transcriptional MerR regulator
MELTINKLAKLAGVSPRTLRYYDAIGLLPPMRVGENGYRIYGQREVDRLQQILFYREMGMPLEDIKKVLSSKGFDEQQALESHLTALLAEKDRIERLVTNVMKTLKALKGEITMSNQEKFDGFLRKLVSENEKRYGAEVRAKYGDDVMDRSNEKVLGMTEETYKNTQELEEKLYEALKAAVAQGDPAGEAAQEACRLHKAWLCRYWDHYSKEAHMGLAEMYVEDPRFTAYYEEIAPGCARFLRDALAVFLKDA